MSDLQPFVQGYFFAALLAGGLSAGAVGVWLIHTLTGGGWGDELKPYYRATARLMPLAAALWIPLFFLLERLYPWADPARASSDPALLLKAAWLNRPFFIARSVLYLAAWTGMALWLRRRNGETRIAGFLAVVHVLVGSFAGMDWVMSLDPRWYSNIFGLVFVTGQVLFSYCAMVAAYGVRCARAGRAPELAARRVDLGSLMLTILMFWAYLAFSQFLIIWMGNLPEEISWYLARVRNGWGFMPYVVIIGHFFVPFFLLLNNPWKASPAFLAAVGGWVALMRVFDMAWAVFPGLSVPLRGLAPAHAVPVAAVAALYAACWRAALRAERGS